jgi:hypothetical protein
MIDVYWIITGTASLTAGIVAGLMLRPRVARMDERRHERRSPS